MSNSKRMRFCFCAIFFFTWLPCLFAQDTNPVLFPQHLSNTRIAKLKTIDSLTYYQCHVTEATQELVTPSGEKIKGKPQRYTITEKFSVIKHNQTYRLKYYTSSFSEYPNKKFSYLKLKEKNYWGFTLEKDTLLSEHDVLMFAAIETKSHDTTEYDFKVTKYSANQLIILGKKVMVQLIVDGDYLLRRSLNVLK